MMQRRNPHRLCRPGAGVAAAVLLASAGTLLVSSCASQRETVTKQERVVVTQPLPDPKMTDIAIYDLREEPAGDPAQVKVVGTIVNRGDRPVSQLSIRVNALDQTGRVVTSVDTPPFEQTIDANGGSATFAALVPRSSAVTTYHATAIAR
jgi:hypothetical protein